MSYFTEVYPFEWMLCWKDALMLSLWCSGHNDLHYCRVRELRRSVSAVNTEQDMVPLFVRLSRRLKSLNTARRFTFLIVFIIVVTLVLSAVRTLSRDPVLVFGNVRNAVRLLLEVLSLFLLLLLLLSDLLFKDFVVLRLKLKTYDLLVLLNQMNCLFKKHY